MLVFVDESGDAGMSQKEGSSAYFIVTAVLFEDHDEAHRCDERIEALRKELGGRAFHFASLKNQFRRAFLEAVVHFDFFYFAVVVDKSKMAAFATKEAFINYAASLVFENAKPRLENAVVVIDGSGSKDFRSRLARYLKERTNSPDGPPRIKKVKTAKSKNNNLIQLADMLSGALWHSFVRGNDTFRQIVAPRELEVELFPRGA